MQSLTGNADSMEKAVARLRLSKRMESDNDEWAGRSFGIKWAMNEATYKELKWLCSNMEINNDLDKVMFARQWYIATVGNDDDFEIEMSSEFFQKHAGDEYPSNAFVAGFATGVVSFWKEVSNKI